MTRIETKDLAGERRVKLWEAVPLTTPWTVYLDATNLCNFACQYCPTGHPEMLKAAGRVQQHMPWDMFLKIVSDLKAFDQKIKIINVYKDGEPLTNPRFVEMINILRDANVAEKIYSKTNGWFIPRHPDLAAAPLDMLGVSVPHINDEGIYKVVNRRVRYEDYRYGVKRLFEDSRRKFTINAKMARYQMTDEDIEQFFHDFEPITDTCAIEGLHGWGNSEAGDMFLEDNGPHDGVPVNYKLACPLPMYMMSVSSNGIANVCCAEWGNYHALGDVTQEHLRDIFNGEKARQFRIMHLEGRRFENKACKDCQYRDCLPDNIDSHRLEMLAKFTEEK